MSKTVNTILTAATILCMVILLVYGYFSIQKLDESKEAKVVSTISKHINYKAETPVMTDYKEEFQDDEIAEDDEFEEFIEEEDDDEIVEEISAPVAAPEVSITKAEANFLIIAGSFKDKSNAEKKVKQYKNIGISADIIHLNNSKLHAICIARSNTEKEANDTLTILKTNHSIKAYVYKIP